MLFWLVQFPFHARQTLKMPKTIRNIHIVSVIVGLLLPLVPFIASLADYAVDVQSDQTTLQIGRLGFGQTRFPTILCSATNKDVAFYSLVLPIDLTLGLGCTLLVIATWFIHKV